MKAHLKYLSYVLRHKWFVLLAGRKLGVPLIQLLLHDWSKFLPSEWFPYARYFYASGTKAPFDVAWNHHQKRNPHHWQYWVLKPDQGHAYSLKMPERYAREMVADWVGAGRAITGKIDVAAWYGKNRSIIDLHPETRELVEELIHDFTLNHA